MRSSLSRSSAEVLSSRMASCGRRHTILPSRHEDGEDDKDQKPMQLNQEEGRQSDVTRGIIRPKIRFSDKDQKHMQCSMQ
jgi:hypothetical protein